MLPIKPQTVRLLDVFVIGPLVVHAAIRATQLPDWQRAALAVIGVGTIAYNGLNYLEIADRGNRLG